MILDDGAIVKHFKGSDLLEKNIYEIVSVNPKYTGTKNFTEEPVVVYKSIFQKGKAFVREYEDFVAELSDEEKEKYGQSYRVEPLSPEELVTIKKPDFIEKKMEYLALKYGDKENKPANELPNSGNVVWEKKK